ncbi:DUF1573 domain-containing protein [Bacteroides oleiciplenus]|uniref:DUF1573 domain-containing protein n=1 Tax=Bacteroides oleiciplenus TaxID=626931 RepID=A0A3E5BEM3_9BACE|nr:DUF1573 domain-containing protein [Bacteroides oleiciplenus]RGN36057.1 DUF1573 domain-containing protein [Bacteroides oleiciplenus]
MKNILIIFCLLIIGLHSCTNLKNDEGIELVNKWIGREIIFPNNMVFTGFGKDTVMQFWPFCSDYSVILYADSIGCLSCRLQLGEWKSFMANCDSISEKHIPVLIYFGSNNMHDISHVLKRDNFTYPVCIDSKDSLNILNQFPIDMAFQTFLVDKNSRVVAIGNPIHNPKIKELYLKIIQGTEVKSDNERDIVQTEASVDKHTISLGRFDWQEEQKASFVLKNMGENLLVIQDVDTSCGCTEVTYSKKPVQLGDSVLLNVTYKAEQSGSFNKTVTVYCNAKSSPIILRITGDAE